MTRKSALRTISGAVALAVFATGAAQAGSDDAIFHFDEDALRSKSGIENMYKELIEQAEAHCETAQPAEELRSSCVRRKVAIVVDGIDDEGLNDYHAGELGEMPVAISDRPVFYFQFNDTAFDSRTRSAKLYDALLAKANEHCEADPDRSPDDVMACRNNLVERAVEMIDTRELSLAHRKDRRRGAVYIIDEN